MSQTHLRQVEEHIRNIQNRKSYCQVEQLTQQRQNLEYAASALEPKSNRKHWSSIDGASMRDRSNKKMRDKRKRFFALVDLAHLT